MEMKEFKKIVDSELVDYGFHKEKNYYYLNYHNVSLIAFLNYRNGGYILSYNFSVHKIHTKNERKKGDPFSGYDSFLIDTLNSKGDKFFDLTNLSEERLVRDMKFRIQKYFEPFKHDIKEYIIREVEKRDKENKGDNIVLLKEIKNYLKIRQ